MPRARPAAAPVDEAVLREDAYLQSKVHAFRVQISRALAGKKAAAAAVPKLASLTVFVASRFSPLQLAVLAVLQPLFAAAPPPVPDDAAARFPADTLARVKAAILADPAHKAGVKAAMEFASVLVAEHRGRPLPLPQLAGTPAIDEARLWADNVEYLKQCLDVPDVRVLKVEDAGVAELDATANGLDGLLADQDRPINQVDPVTSESSDLAPPEPEDRCEVDHEPVALTNGFRQAMDVIGAERRPGLVDDAGQVDAPAR